MKAYQLPDLSVRYEADAYAPATGETLLPALPVWDAATQRIDWSGSAWIVSALSAAALAAKSAEAAVLATIAADKTERQAIKSIYAALKAGTATTAQVQRVVAFLLKNL